MAIQYVQAITLDLSGRPVFRCVSAKRGDTASRFVRITLEADGAAFDPTGLEAKLRCLKPNGGFVMNPAVINEDGTVTVELTSQILAESGSVFADLCLCGKDGEIISTASFAVQVEAVPYGRAINSSSEFLDLMATIEKSNTLIGDYESALVKLDEIWQSVKQFAPTVTVEAVEGGHSVTVVDQDGTKTFLVADGAQGPAGENGTATDAQVAAWLDDHPEATTTVLDGAVTPEKTSFILYDRVVSSTNIPNFTNQIPVSVDTDGSVYNGKGWKENTRVNSSGEEAEVEGFHITGFIPCVAGDLVRTGPGVILETNDYQAVVRYDASKTYLGRISYNAFAENGFSVSEDGALYAPQSESLTAMGYIRIVGGGIGDDAVVTVNEEITYTVAESEGAPDNLRLDEAVAVPLAQRNEARLAVAETAIAALQKGEAVDYVQSEAERVAALVADVQNENTFTFAAVSDLHYVANDVNTPAILHLGQAVEIISRLVKLDAAVMLGDAISGASNDTLDTCKACFAYVNRVVAEGFSGIPNVRLNGNHDCQPYCYDGFLTQGEIFARVGAWNSGAAIDQENRAANYGCWDFESRKLRLIYLNTCDIDGIRIKSRASDFTGNRIGVAQLKWLIQVLLSTPSEWGILLMGHHPLDWVSNYYTDADGVQWEQNTSNAAVVLSAYTQGASGSVWLEGTQIPYDFSGTERAQIIAYFHGHIHNYKVGTMGDGQILRVAIPNALPGRENSYSAVEGMYESVSYPKIAGTAEDTAFCVVTVDPAARKIYAHHYGAGYDREISFA